MRLSGIAKFLTLTGLLAVASTAFAQKTQLLVYTALETDQLRAYQEGFNKSNPDIEIKWVRDSTGVITAKLLAKKANPQADAVMGVAAKALDIVSRTLLRAGDCVMVEEPGWAIEGRHKNLRNTSCPSLAVRAQR